MGKARCALAVLIGATQVGCYHWVPTTIDEVRAHPWGDLRVDEEKTIALSSLCRTPAKQTLVDVARFDSTASVHVIEALACQLPSTTTVRGATEWLDVRVDGRPCWDPEPAAVKLAIELAAGDGKTNVTIESDRPDATAIVGEARDDLMHHLATLDDAAPTKPGCTASIVSSLSHAGRLDREQLDVAATAGIVTTAILVVGGIIAAVVIPVVMGNIGGWPSNCCEL